MTLTVPQYVKIPGIQDPTIRFTWDDWNVEAVDLPLDDSLQKRLQIISHRAVAALTIGIAEWIVYRFARLSSDPVPDLRLEAAWAQVVDVSYSNLEDIRLEEWRGPVRGPLGIALRRVIFALDQAGKGLDPVWRAGRASKLAEHVLPDPEPYRKWREMVIQRLEKLYPLDLSETLGDVVPREAMDPTVSFDLTQTEGLINRFLVGLDCVSNPFLNTPEAMLENGFEGHPYTFNAAEDRRQRFEW
jgi:hypothetical protein